MGVDVDEGMGMWKSEDTLCVCARVLPRLFQSGSLIGQWPRTLQRSASLSTISLWLRLHIVHPAVPVSLCGSGVYECQ